MNPFNTNNPFGTQTNGNPFSADYLDQIKEMVEQYNSVLNDDFWQNMNGLSRKKGQIKGSFPIEMWESDEELYVLAYIPGIKEANQVKTSFLSEKKVKIKARRISNQPPMAKRQLSTELKEMTMEREVNLPYKVIDDNYSIHMEEGITTLIFSKADPNVKVVSGASAFVIGKSQMSEFSSDSKTNNGVGSAYGDNSHIDMSPQHLTLNDEEFIESYSPKPTKEYNEYTLPPKSPFYDQPPYWGWVPPNER